MNWHNSDPECWSWTSSYQLHTTIIRFICLFVCVSLEYLFIDKVVKAQAQSNSMTCYIDGVQIQWDIDKVVRIYISLCSLLTDRSICGRLCHCRNARWFATKNRLHLVLICVTRRTPRTQSIIWWSPRPGHSPRFDPKKLRESMKLNWSTEVFLTRTSLSKLKLTNVVLPFWYSGGNVVVIFFLTVAVVRRQGSRQSDTRIP